MLKKSGDFLTLHPTTGSGGKYVSTYPLRMERRKCSAAVGWAAAIAVTARLAYNEPYVAVPMTHRIEPAVASENADRVEYAWRMGRDWTRIEARPTGEPASLAPGSHEEFIAEHYWGYTRQRDGGTIEYRVTHRPWHVRHIPAPTIEGDLTATYGPVFGKLLERSPDSALLADGSPVAVHLPSRIERQR